MPARTRAEASATAGRVYSSPVALQQVKFKRRKQNIAHLPSFNSVRRSRQETLTQMDFVNLQQLGDVDEDISIEEEEEDYSRKRKRRRTEGDAPNSAKFHTQTLTQLDFISSPAPRLESTDDEADDECTSTQKWPRSMGPPKTPNRRRIFEILSSQSPTSSSPIQSRKRSPLQAINLNLRDPNPSLSLEENIQKSPKVEPIDAIDFGDNSQHSRIKQTPESSQQPKQEQITPPVSHKPIKDEILDSDDDNDDFADYDYLDLYYDRNPDRAHELELEPATRAEASSTIKQSPIRDTQEATEQLQSDILHYTQFDPIQSQSQSPFPRPSQATTVDLTQQLHPYSPYSQHDPYPRSERESLILDSPTLRISSSQSPVRPSSRLSLPIEDSQDVESISHGTSGIPVPLFLPSSQILTRSQMLPKSLMQDSITPPPYFVEDSDLEE